MARGNDFSATLPDIAAPVSPNGERLVEASKNRGEAMVVAANAEAGAVKFLGTTAAQATEGKLLANQETDIKVVTDKLEPIVEGRIDQNNRKLQGQFLESFKSDDFAGSQTVAAFQAEAQKYADAQRQGVIPREEALTRIADIVKNYSAMAPGWASEFRKGAAEITGITHADSFGVHQALTTQSRSEKLREKEAEAQLALDKEIAQTYGVALNQISPSLRNSYASYKQMGVAVQQLEYQKKSTEIVQSDWDKVNTQLASVYIAQGVAGISASFSRLYAANLSSDTPLKQEEAQKLGGQLAGQLEVLHTELETRINNLTVGKNPLSRAAADQILSGLRSQMDGWKSAVKTADGFNLWAKTIANAKGNVEYIVKQTELAAPHLAVLKELGVLPELAKSWLTIGDAKKFESMFGKDLALALSTAFKNPASYATGFKMVATGQTTVEDEARRDPNMGTVLYNDVVKMLDKTVKEQGGVLRNDQEKVVFSNFLAAFGKQVNHTNPAELKKFQDLMYKPEMLKLLDQLDDNQRKNALAPIFAKIDYTVPQELTSMKSAVESYNQLESNQLYGHRAEIYLDPVTEQLRLSVVNVGESKTKRPQGKNPNEFFTHRSDPHYLFSPGGSNPRQYPDQREQLESVERSLAWLNTSAYVVANTLPKVNGSVGNINVADVLRNVKDGYDTGTMGRLMGGMVQQAVAGKAVPANTTAKSVEGRKVAAANADADQNPPSADELKGIHTRNIIEIEKELKRPNLTPPIKTILEEQLKLNRDGLQQVGS